MTMTNERLRELAAAYAADLRDRGELERTAQFFAPELAEAFTERRCAVDDVFAQDGTAVVRLRFDAVHTGTFAGHAPTGRSVAITQFLELAVADGRLEERFRWFDTGTLLPQLRTG